ncbi:MAG TPA: zf-HC2 domain-containing protein [Candidatus Heimdallarchaeota archaeon]|nr:zf-HC2 domain-containing protein [Candidatus Heimdallarchaeota archaeon]
MKCLTAKKWISEYIDGEVDAAKKAKLDEHCTQCADCQKLLEDFQTISSSAKELDTFSPPESTWGKIQEKMTADEQEVLTLAPQKQGWFSIPRLSYVLSAVLLVVFLSLVFIYGPRYWSGQAVVPELENQQYTLTKLEEAEHHYQLAIKALNEAAMAQKEQLDPQVAEVFRTNLDLIDQSINACRQAVLTDPNDIESRKYLLAAYKEKANLLNVIMAVKDTSSPERETKETI